MSEVAGYSLIRHYVSGTHLDIYPIVTLRSFHDRNTVGA
jgi:hypothetical protein